MIKKPCNPNAIPEVGAVLNYLASMEGKKILTGQHTQSRPQEELVKIHEKTGTYPAVIGFELLSYSPNIDYDNADEECLAEVYEARGTLEQAYEWAEKGALLTFTWHWFSPLYGESKSFYTEHTAFDPEKVLTEGTPEREAFYSDLDKMAELLKGFLAKQIPILWRPFHESEGKWFWWGSKGPEVAAKLYRLMYDYFTVVHELHHLIWVWNCPLPEGYVGDDVCDIISRDLYAEAHSRTNYRKEYDELRKITSTDKGAALGEIGILPDPEMLMADPVPWLWYMTWSHDFCLTEDFNTYDALKKLYQSDAFVTLDRLPKGLW